MTNLSKYEHKQSLMPTSSFGKRIDHFFGDFFSDFDRSIFKHHHVKEPKVNLSEDSKNYYVEAALPGFKKEEVLLNCKNNMLSIEAKREDKKEESKKDYYHSEYYSGSFYRSFQLPQNADAKKIDAEMKDGLLKITLPKSEEKTSSENSITIR